MEDIKKIQEFFSKPIKENSRRSPDFILIDPAEIKYTESFGSGIKAPGVLHHANEGVFLGAEGAYIIVLPGGTFYVDEDKEEAIRIYPLKDQSRELQLALDYTPFSPKYETWKSWVKEPKTLDEYGTGIYYKGEETKDKTKEASKSALEKVKDMIQKVLKEEEGYSQFLKTDDNPEGKTKGLDTATMNKILMNVIKDIEETIELGKNLEEGKLCKKGEAYRKRRMAAGEKSSAYLSGRAVKVCKGQMSGKKKKK